MVRPHVAIVTTVAPVHLEQFQLRRGRSPRPRRRSSPVSNRAARPSSTATRRVLLAAGRARRAPIGAKVVTFGEHAEADARLIKCSLNRKLAPRSPPTSSGEVVTFKLGRAGPAHRPELAGRAGGGEDRRRRPRPGDAGLAGAPAAEGARRQAPANCVVFGGHGDADRRELQRQPHLHAGGPRAARLARWTGSGRRVAVLGDMLELGPRPRRTLHAGLAEAARRRRRSVDQGLLRRSADAKPLAGALPSRQRGAAMPSTRPISSPW